MASVDIFYQRDDPCFFQQDGSPAHREKLIKEYFYENNIEFLPWCARSSDLNPIENLWSYMMKNW